MVKLHPAVQLHKYTQRKINHIHLSTLAGEFFVKVTEFKFIFTTQMVFKHTLLSQNGSEWLFAFYGYGQQPAVFQPLSDAVSHRYNILVIHHPEQEASKALTISVFVEEMHLLIKHYQIKQFTTLSYSMGSRLNLLLVQYFPECINQVFLFAPDGIQPGFWNRLATTTSIGRSLFRMVTTSSFLAPTAIRLFYSLHFIPRALYTFAAWHMRDADARMRVYIAWMNMRLLLPDLNEVNAQQKKYKINMQAFFGKFDPVIASKVMHKLKQSIPDTTCILLDKGHALLDTDFVQLMKNRLSC